MLTTLGFLAAIIFSQVRSRSSVKKVLLIHMTFWMACFSKSTFLLSPRLSPISPHEILKREYLNGVKKWTRQFFLAKALVKVHYSRFALGDVD